MFAPSEPTRGRVQRAPSAAAAVAIIGVLGLFALWRWSVLRAHVDPVGVDIGNWLALGNAIGARHVSGSDAVYPPMIPAIVRGATALVGMPAAAPLTAALAATAPAAGVWVATKPSLGVRWATLGALSLAAAGATSAAAAWGGLPQLVGLGLAPVVLVAASALVAEPTRRRAVLLGGLLLALAAASPLLLGLTVIAVIITVALATIVMRTGRWVPYAALSLAFLLPIAPLYYRFLSTATVSTDGSGALAQSSATLKVVFIGATGWWCVLGFAAIVAPFLTWSHRFDPLWAASTALTSVAVAALLTIGEPRFWCLAPVAAVMGSLMLAARAPVPARRPLAVAVVFGILGTLIVAPRVMDRQRDAYARFVPRGTGDVIDWVRANTSPRDRFAIAPVAGVPFGWWVEGWAQRPSLVAADPAFLDFPGERRRAAAATALFTGSRWPDESTFARARRLGVRWLYVPATWGGVDGPALRAAARHHAGLVAYRGRGALVLRTPAS